ncbi:unnamed protein product, partial [Brachionus calyciflorus]
MNESNSPILSRLRSNKNYKTSSNNLQKRLIKPSGTSGISDDFGLLVEKLCIGIGVPEEVQNTDTV